MSALSKVKLLNKELAALREAGAQAAESLQSTEAARAELAGQLQRKELELRDLAAVKDARCAPQPCPVGGCGRREGRQVCPQPCPVGGRGCRVEHLDLVWRHPPVWLRLCCGLICLPTGGRFFPG